MRARSLTAVGVICGLALVAGLRADVRWSKRDAETLRQKVATITAHGERQAKQARRTTLTESEVNSYLVYDAPAQLPVGVVEPTITILGPGRLSGRAIVDLDAVRRNRRPTSLLDPVTYLSGRLPVTATGTLRTANGVGRFQFESAAVGMVPVPKMLLQEIISFYTSTKEDPDGIGLDDAFQLPARIREIQVDRGQAIVVQ